MDRSARRLRWEPTVVVVQGASGSGKTYVARRLAEDLDLPLVAKDDFKELLFERLGWIEDRDQSQRLGRAAMGLLYRSMDLLLTVPADFIVEAKFDPVLAGDDFSALRDRHPFCVVQILCQAEPEVRLRRIQERVRDGSRHPGHIDHLYLESLSRLPSDDVDPIPVPGTVHRIDTSDGTEEAVRYLVGTLRKALAEGSADPERST